MLKGCCKESFAFYLYFHSSHAYTLAHVRTDAHRQKRKLEIPTVKVYTGNVFLLSRAKRGRRQGDIYHHITVWCSTSVFLHWTTLASLATINKPFLESSFYPAQRAKFHGWVGPRAGSSTLFNLDRIFFFTLPFWKDQEISIKFFYQETSWNGLGWCNRSASEKSTRETEESGMRWDIKASSPVQLQAATIGPERKVKISCLRKISLKSKQL